MNTGVSRHDGTVARVARLGLCSALFLALTGVWLWQLSPWPAVGLLLLAAVTAYFHLPVYMLLKTSLAFRLSPPVRRFWQAVLTRLGIPALALISLNNRAVRLVGGAWDSVLVMVSRCLQWSGCNRDVINDLGNCTACGRCKLGAIRTFCAKAGIRVTVEGGGTAARQRLAALKPDLVVAVACERELLEGMAATRVPVVGVPLTAVSECVNNDVDVSVVTAYLNQIIKEG